MCFVLPMVISPFREDTDSINSKRWWHTAGSSITVCWRILSPSLHLRIVFAARCLFRQLLRWCHWWHLSWTVYSVQQWSFFNGLFTLIIKLYKCFDVLMLFCGMCWNCFMDFWHKRFPSFFHFSLPRLLSGSPTGFLNFQHFIFLFPCFFGFVKVFNLLALVFSARPV